MGQFFKALEEQRWDDHRYYHHSRINQSLHLLSALSFMVAYVWLFIDPAISALIAWGISMVSRQAGHFFFEPKGYDHINKATHEHKEAIKVGYNLQRKVVLMAVSASSPLWLMIDPSLLGWLKPHQSWSEFVHNVGSVWLVIGVGGLLFRTVHLFFIRDVATGLTWATKILTDPFHDARIYWRSPLYLLKGELIAPGPGARH